MFSPYYTTRLRIDNNTDSDIVRTSVYETDDFDWSVDSGPHRNFQDVAIDSKMYSEREEKIKKIASHCPFTMILYFKDGSQDTFRIHQRHAVGCCADFKRISGTHNFKYEVIEGNCLRITVGKDCKPIKDEDLPRERKTEDEMEVEVGVGPFSLRYRRRSSSCSSTCSTDSNKN